MSVHGGSDPVQALTGSMRDYRELRGKDLISRVGGFYEWQDLRRQRGLWPYSKSTERAPLAVCSARDDSGLRFAGLNFADELRMNQIKSARLRCQYIGIIEFAQAEWAPAKRIAHADQFAFTHDDQRERPLNPAQRRENISAIFRGLGQEM